MKKILALTLALVLCLGMLTACGSSASSAEASAPASSAEASAPAEGVGVPVEKAPVEPAGSSETASAGELSTVTDGVLTMATNAAFPPYEMTTDDGGFEGIDVEIATAIAEKLGLKLQIDDVEFDAALLSVQQGKSDIAMAGITVNEDRLAVMDFSDSYATGVQVVVTKEGSDVTLENLGEHMIGTQRATTGNIYCVDDYGEDHVTAYDNCLTAAQALNNDQIDCIVIDSAPADELVKANPGFKVLDTEYVTEDYAIGMAKGNTALVNAVNQALKELTDDGTVQKIVDKYITAE